MNKNTRRARRQNLSCHSPLLVGHHNSYHTVTRNVEPLAHGYNVDSTNAGRRKKKDYPMNGPSLHDQAQQMSAR